MNWHTASANALDRSMVSRDVRLAEDAQLEDCVLMEGSEVGPGARLFHCVVGRGAVVGSGCELNRCFVAPGCRVDPNSTFADDIAWFSFLRVVTWSAKLPRSTYSCCSAQGEIAFGQVHLPAGYQIIKSPYVNLLCLNMLLHAPTICTALMFFLVHMEYFRIDIHL